MKKTAWKEPHSEIIEHFVRYLFMQTLSRPVEFTGVSFWNSKPCRIKLTPRSSPGWSFVVQSERSSTLIPADVASLAERRTLFGQRTVSLVQNGCHIDVIEHLMSLRLGLGLDAVTVFLPDGKIPYTASAAPFIEALPPFKEIGEPILSYSGNTAKIVHGKTTLSYVPEPHDHLIVNIETDYPQPFGCQKLVWAGDADRYRQLAAGRTLSWRWEHVAALKIAKGLGIPLAVLSDQEYSLTPGNFLEKRSISDGNGGFVDVAAHRLIDFLGIAALLPGRLVGTVHLVRSSHRHEAELVRQIKGF